MLKVNRLVFSIVLGRVPHAFFTESRFSPSGYVVRRAVERRLSLTLLAGSLLKAIAAGCEALPMGPWDRGAVSSAGRLANRLEIHADNFVAFALPGTAPRKYNESKEAKETADSQLPLAA